MNFKSVIFDYALPSAAIIGTGLITFALTGGQEEFPTVDEDDDVEFIEGQDDNHGYNDAASNMNSDERALSDERLDEFITDTERRADEFSQSLQQLNSKLLKLENNEPAWAKELVDMTRSLASELEDLKKLQLSSKLICNSCEKSMGLKIVDTSDNNDGTLKNESSTPTERPKELRDWIKEMHSALYAFSCGNHDINSDTTDLFKLLQSQSEQSRRLLYDYKSSSDEKALSAGCSALLMYIGNIIKNPGVPRYRRISVSNSSFKSALGSLAGYELVLTAVGFVRKGSYFEWDWHSIPAADIDISSTQNVGQLQDKGISQSSDVPVKSSSLNDGTKKARGTVRFSDFISEKGGIEESKTLVSESGSEKALSDEKSHDTATSSCEKLPSGTTLPTVELPYQETKIPADAETVQLLMKECTIALEQLKISREAFIDYLLMKVKDLHPTEVKVLQDSSKIATASDDPIESNEESQNVDSSRSSISVGNSSNCSTVAEAADAPATTSS